MKKLNLLLTGAVLAMFATSCDPFDTEPNNSSNTPAELPEVGVRFNLKKGQLSLPDTNFRYVSYIYDAKSNMPVDTVLSHYSYAKLRLPKGTYRMETWADFYPIVARTGYYFLNNEADRMTLIDKTKYRADDQNKIAYFGSTEFTVNDELTKVKSELKPQMGQFQIFASDAAHYKVSRIEISYPKGVPASLDTKKLSVCSKWDGITYNAKYENDFITFDNILCNEGETTVTVTIKVYDQSNYMRSIRENIEIPIVKGEKRGLKTKIFTAYPNGIDMGFDEDNEIWIF